MNYVPVAMADKDFIDRMRRVQRRHSKLAKGYMMTVNHDGLVVPEPKPLALRFPIRGLIATGVAVLAFKAFALVYLGPSNYDAKIALLAGGTGSERVAGFLMQADPVSRTIAQKTANFIE